jgi:UDP-glucose 4-epimerase
MRYAITGGSGYIGTRLIEILAPREATEAIVNIDIRPPQSPRDGVEFVQGDVRDQESMRAVLERAAPDALVHLAFLLDPIHDEARMYDIDVNGTQAVLRAASEAGVGQVLVTSSATAYGAFPDNPVPITEDWPVRGAPDFSYARHKTEADRLCQLWAAEHPDRVMTIVRPCIVFGPNVDNYLVRSWKNAAFMPIIDGIDQQFQLVHEDDVVSALIGLLDAKAAGPFNLAGDGTMTYRESAELIGKKTREIKLKTLKRIYGVAWKLHAPRIEAPEGNLDFVRYPWIVSTERLREATGWAPTKDTRQIFLETMRDRGLVGGEATPTPVVAG